MNVLGRDVHGDVSFFVGKFWAIAAIYTGYENLYSPGIFRRSPQKKKDSKSPNKG
jgi:hypothetical protein